MGTAAWLLIPRVLMELLLLLLLLLLFAELATPGIKL